MTDKSDSDEESYSYTSSKIFYKRSRSKPQDVASTKVYVSNTDDVDDASEYRPVTKWAVDYNNRNYIRSMCNKNKGLHRELKGRPPKFKIHYDNNYFTRSKVNAPKGLHRKIPEIKRKYVPDNDELADATGWEFDYGPEFDQVEGDINYIPEGRIIRRGGYRWYGVKRNDSDCDIKVEEERENLLNEELEQELKYGQEFLQSDIPYLEEERNKRYTRGGYRFYEVPRNIHDFKPEELDEIPRDPEWKRKYHCNGVRYLDLEMGQSETDDDTSEHRHQTKKGKPFRRTILNKVYELKKEDSSKDAKRHGTRLSLVPGEGRQSLYEGIPDRQRYETEKTNNVRSVYKKKTEKFRSSREGGEYEEYQTEDTEKSYTELRPAFEERQHGTAEIRSGRRLPDEDVTRKEKGGRRFDDYTHKVKPEDKFKPRRQGRNGSTTDVKQKIETWKEDKFKPRGQGRNGNTSDARERFETFKEDKYKPRREGRNGNTTDARESFETFKESTLYEKEADERDHRIVEKKSNETFYKKRGFPLKDSAVERRRNKEKYYDRQELPSQKEMIRSQDRRHGNEIYKQTEVGTVFNQGTKIKGKTRDGNKINIHLQHIRDRGKIPKDANSFETKLTADKQKILKKTPPYVDERVKNTMGRKERKTELVDRKGTEKVSKKMPPHVDERVKNVLGRIERKIELGDRKDKGEVVKKMPPHVEERIKNIREKLERKIEPADRKHTGQRGRNIYDLSSSDEGIDLMKHKDHPNDRGETHNSGYEKYITKNGSEIWVKKNEKYAELHHKSHR